MLISKNMLSKKIKKYWNKFQKKTNIEMEDGQKIWKILMPELWKASLFDKTRKL